MNRDCHERLIDMLSTLLLQINALQSGLHKESGQAVLDPTALSDGLKVVEQMTRDALFLARTSIDDQPPPELEGVTLAEALSRIVEETAETLGLASRVSISGVDEQGKPKEQSLSVAAERMLYLIAQEALYEVKGRTGGRRLRLTLNYGQNDVQMSIEDDGMNIVSQETVDDLSAPPFGKDISVNRAVSAPALSIINDLRYRLECMGGSLEIILSGSQGTRVLARVPYTPVGQDVVSGPLAHVEVQEMTEPVPLTILQPPPEEAAPVERVRVLLVDSQAVTRAGLHRLLESYAGLQVVGEAADGVQAVSETLELGPQVVLMDAQLPNGQSLEALRQIKQLNLATRVLLLSTQDREEYLYETLRAGADGYILKDIAPDELAEAVRAVARGEVLIQPQLAGRLLSRFGKQGRGGGRYDALTTRELEVLRLLARGLRNKEIAARLYVSERTVNFHLANIYQKLNVSGRTEALSKALEQGLITA
ncbi:MAG TPA: response regulator [Ktedonosporobacter sp.]|nr:response regulator [Ktedonosporobacter sp.]